jgi:histidine triad (HIT) family protein
MQEDSIFTKIVKGELPCYKIYEDDLTLAFLDIHPATPGHTLVIPKKQVEFVWDLEDEDYHAVMATAKKIALRQREILQTPFVGEMVIGVDVPHAHVHVIPFEFARDLARPLTPSEAEPDHDALRDMAARLAI